MVGVAAGVAVAVTIRPRLVAPKMAMKSNTKPMPAAMVEACSSHHGRRCVGDDSDSVSDEAAGGSTLVIAGEGASASGEEGVTGNSILVSDAPHEAQKRAPSTTGSLQRGHLRSGSSI